MAILQSLTSHTEWAASRTAHIIFYVLPFRIHIVTVRISTVTVMYQCPHWQANDMILFYGDILYRVCCNCKIMAIEMNEVMDNTVLMSTKENRLWQMCVLGAGGSSIKPIRMITIIVTYFHSSALFYT